MAVTWWMPGVGAGMGTKTAQASKNHGVATAITLAWWWSPFARVFLASRAATAPMERAGSWRFEYDPPTLYSGRGCVEQVAAELDRAGLDRALIVCGRTVGSVSAVMDPLRASLGHRLAEVFDETEPAKRFETAVAGAERVMDTGADAVIGLGGGSSLDIARFVAVIAGASTPPAELRAELLETGSLSVDTPVPPVIQLPTTLAGAELSNGAGITIVPEDGGEDAAIGTGLSHPTMMPAAVVADPDLVATTPPGILRNAAMNGFNKGIESLYSRTATPITDGTATRGLALLREHLRRLAQPDPTGADLEPIVNGSLLVQYGRARPDTAVLSLLHAFGHALSRTYPLQQGLAHAVITPHALRYLFDQVDGRRALLARTLGRDEADDPAAAVVESVAELRDALQLPTRLRDVDGPGPADFPAVAHAVLDDHFMENAPSGLDPTVDELVTVLEDAY